MTLPHQLKRIRLELARSKDFPTGSLGYKIIATEKDGRVHTWEPFNIRNSQLTIVGPGSGRKKKG